jgi:hypothetical protein
MRPCASTATGSAPLARGSTGSDHPPAERPPASSRCTRAFRRSVTTSSPWGSAEPLEAAELPGLGAELAECALEAPPRVEHRHPLPRRIDDVHRAATIGGEGGGIHTADEVFERRILQVDARAFEAPEQVVIEHTPVLLIQHAHIGRAERRDRSRPAQLAFTASEQAHLAEPATVALEALDLVELCVAHPDAPERIAGDPGRLHHLPARVALRRDLAARDQAERQDRGIARGTRGVA